MPSPHATTNLAGAHRPAVRDNVEPIAPRLEPLDRAFEQLRPTGLQDPGVQRAQRRQGVHVAVLLAS